MSRVYLLMAVAVLCLGAETAFAQEPARYIYSDVVFLGDDESNMTIDIGLISTGNSSIGDFVWKDFNKNGKQDEGEPGISNVLVLLYYEEGSGYQKFGQTYTDPNGYYKFENLPAGTYIVVVDRDTLPEDWRAPTTPHATGSTNEDDSNAIGSTDTLPPV